MNDALTNQTGSSPDDGYQYWAFVSYSHHDKAWAEWLHKSLETYKVPRRLVGRKTPLGTVPRRVYPVFRDRDELSGGFDLSEKIKLALRQSRYLAVICSPHAAASKYVINEIDTFEALGREERVVCLIVDGEPNASDRPGGLLECFPAPVRHRRSEEGDVAGKRTDPIAADVRKGKDGATNAKLKVLASILGVGYDDLKQRENQRRFWQRLRLAVSLAFLMVMPSLGYFVVADAGLDLPGGRRIRTFMDRHQVSVLRPIYTETEIRRAAAPLRTRLFESLHSARTNRGWFLASFQPEDLQEPDVWIHSQTLSALLSMRGEGKQELRDFVEGLELPFTAGVLVETKGIKYGWPARLGESSTIAVPALWTALSLSMASQRCDLLADEKRRKTVEWLADTQEILKIYRPLESGGWNLFPNQRDPSHHNTYATTLALMALLETRRAGVPWQGSIERRDALIRATAQWIVERYDSGANPPGWHAGGESLLTASDGLTLQIYGRLLQAEAEVGLNIPFPILNQIPRHLAKCAERSLSFPVTGGEFSTSITDGNGQKYVARESINFLWYPWAIDCAARWLQRAEKHGALREDCVGVRRALGHLVVDLGEDAIKDASSGWTFIAAEILYGLAAIPPL